MLKIGNDFIFEDDLSGRRSSLMYFEGDDDEPASWSVDVGFSEGDYKGEKIKPSFCVNPIETRKRSAAELAGEVFSVASIKEAVEREDSFYIYEHEPLVEYELSVVEIKNGMAHIRCKGTIVEDGYAKPYTTEKFEMDCRVPVITSVDDWEKFGL